MAMRGTIIYLLVLFVGISFSLDASNPDREEDKISVVNVGRILKTLSSSDFEVEVYESYISIYSVSYVGDAEIEVLDSTGSVVISDDFTFDLDNECLINISSLDSGEYSICITYSSASETLTFTVD
jgi:hypothetical protein